MSELQSVKEKVLQILKEFPDARNNDNVLLLQYWTRFDDKIFQKVIDIIGVDSIARLTNFDSIRRVRQQIQNQDGEFKPDPKVIEGRLARQAEIQKHYREKKIKPEDVPHLCSVSGCGKEAHIYTPNGIMCDEDYSKYKFGQ